MFEAPAHFYNEPRPRQPIKTYAPKSHRKMVVRIGDVIQAAMSVFIVTKAELLGPCRSARFVRARHVAWYICRKHTKASLPALGRRFGKDHTSILYGIQKIESNLEAYRSDINAMRGKLKFSGENARQAKSNLSSVEIAR